MLSKRADRFMQPSMAYIPLFVKMLNNKYTEDNPTGGIVMCVAENVLCSDLLLDRIKSFNDYSHAVLNYTACTGMPQLRSVLSKFIGDRLFDV